MSAFNFTELPAIVYLSEGTKHHGAGWYYRKNGYLEGPFTRKDLAEKSWRESMTTEERAAIEETLALDRTIAKDLENVNGTLL